MRILLIGSSGLIGDALWRRWTADGKTLTGTRGAQDIPGRRPLDIRDLDAVRRLVKETAADVVAMPACNPYVDYIELHPEETAALNVAGSLNVLAAAREAGARLVFFSSDYVFDGENDPYREDDRTGPINEYGRQKDAVEKAILADSGPHLIVRVSGVYGWERRGKNYVYQTLRKLQEGQAVRAPVDLEYNPTCAENVAAIVSELLEGGHRGIFHVVGADRLSRFEFAQRIASAYGFDDRRVERATMAEFPSPTKRPARSGLSTEKARRTVTVPIWGVEEGLRRMRGTWAEQQGAGAVPGGMHAVR